MREVELDVTLSFIQSHPETAARELEMLPMSAAMELFRNLPLIAARKFITYLLPPYAANLCISLTVSEAANLISGGNANQIASILRYFPNEHCSKLLQTLPEKKARLCRLLLSYSDDAVGAWMFADIIMFTATTSAEAALKRLAKSSSFADFNLLPVVDEKRNFVGMTNVGVLLQVAGHTQVGQLIKKPTPVLQSRTSVATASKHSGWLKYDSLAVLNHSRQLIGLLRQTELKRSLKQFGEVSGKTGSNGLLGSIGEAYAGSLSALLNLVGEEITTNKKQGDL